MEESSDEENRRLPSRYVFWLRLLVIRSRLKASAVS